MLGGCGSQLLCRMLGGCGSQLCRMLGGCGSQLCRMLGGCGSQLSCRKCETGEIKGFISSIVLGVVIVPKHSLPLYLLVSLSYIGEISV